MSSGPGPIPERWINCPRKATKLVRDKFLAFKTPLAPKFDPQVPEEARFPPEMLLESTKNYSKNRLGLWIDLTNTTRYYDCNVVKQYYDDGKAIGYMKLDCKGRGEAPNEEQTKTFIKLCQNFIKKHPLEIIGVHCTHGFNRTGFLIAAYLVEEYDLSVAAAIQEFAIARPPGIYKGDYIKELFRRYDDVEDAPNPPIRPSWCFDDYQNGHSSSYGGASDNEDDDGVRQPGSKYKLGNSSGKNKKRRQGTKNPTFMAGVPGVEPVTDPELLNELRHLTQHMCNTEDISFPGSQPVSMTHDNLLFLKLNPYMVSWKADGTRYMMLITDNHCVYFIDRNNDYFQVHGLTFVHRKDITQPLTNTLMDGEMVIDKFQGQDIPRYLIYDIIYVNNMDVSKMRFSPERLKVIEADVIRPRHQAIVQGHIDKLSEPFSVRLKDFYPINKTKSFLGQKFSRQLTHEPDGLIFQPSNDHYKPGQCPEVLKWKPSTLNSIDFRVKIAKEEGEGIISKKVIFLYVGSLHKPFDKMNYKKHLEQYNNKIIECKFENGRWVFMRERTDKTFPNSYQTALSVMESIKCPVTKEHLLEFIEMHVDRNLMPPPSGFRS